MVEALPASIELIVVSFTIFASLGILAGIVWAYWPRGVHAFLLRVVAVAGSAVPVFWVGLILQIVLAARLGWFPVAGNLNHEAAGIAEVTGAGLLDALIARSPSAMWEAARVLFLPVMTIVIHNIALTIALMRSSLADQLDREYVRAARARGLSEWRVVVVDALRNALNPVVTMLGLQLGWLLGGGGDRGGDLLLAGDRPLRLQLLPVVRLQRHHGHHRAGHGRFRAGQRAGRPDLPAARSPHQGSPMSVADLPATPETVSRTRTAGRGVFWWSAATVLALAALVLIPGFLAPGDPYNLDIGNRFTAPQSGNLFGTDDAGRDILSRVIHGARYSIGSAVLIVTVAVVVGTVYGSLAAWYGGILDRLLMRTVDVFLAFPYLVFAMAVAASLGRGLTSTIVALSLLWWPSYARMIRGSGQVDPQRLPHPGGDHAGGSPGPDTALARHPPHLQPASGPFHP